MSEWIKQSLGPAMLTAPGLLAPLLLGLISSVTSCCNLTILGALAGYSGAESESKRSNTLLISGFSFMIGTVISLAAIGAATGFISQTAGAVLGMYWKLFAGCVMVLFGIASLDLLPFKIPRMFPQIKALPEGTTQALIYGLAIGGGTAACSVFCNPLLPVALGAATLHGHPLWGAGILCAYSIGFSLPLALGLMGLSFGFTRLTSGFRKYSAAIRMSAGVILIGVGFYLLLTASS